MDQNVYYPKQREWLDPAWHQSVRKIAVYRALYLGDLLCITPALRALRQHFPFAEITLIGLPWGAELVDRLASVDRLLEFPGYPGIAEVPYVPERTQAFLAAAQAEQYDIAIQMHGSGQVSNGFVADLGGRLTIGYCAEYDDRLDYGLIYEATEHETLRWLRLVAEVGARSADTRLDLPVRPEEHAEAIRLLHSVNEHQRPLIGIHPGAKDTARRWSPERFATVADALVERFGACVVLTGTASERPLTTAVAQAMRSPALDLAGQTDLGTFAALLSQFDLLVTNDTGASHIAAATGTASVVLFGPTRPHQWAPLDRQRHRVVDAQTLAPAAEPESALANLTVDDVLPVCIDALSQQMQSADDQANKLAGAPSLVIGV